jgi:hypothetical protein
MSNFFMHYTIIGSIEEKFGSGNHYDPTSNIRVSNHDMNKDNSYHGIDLGPSHDIHHEWNFNNNKQQFFC